MYLHRANSLEPDDMEGREPPKRYIDQTEVALALKGIDAPPEMQELKENKPNSMPGFYATSQNIVVTVLPEYVASLGNKLNLQQRPDAIQSVIIAEVQLMTPEQAKIERETRAQYEKACGKFDHSNFKAYT